MEFQEWQANWEAFGRDDPLWAILTDPSKKSGKWSPQEFFQTGETEIRAMLASASRLKPDFVRGKALDFGCGVGRLTQALGREFQEVHGVDVSSSMIAHAERFNRIPERCHYRVNDRPDLSRFPDATFDFVYSNITLQHIENRFSKIYLAEFVRILKTSGLAVFQVLEPCLWRSLVPGLLVDVYRRRRAAHGPVMGMFGLRRRTVQAVVTGAGGQVLEVEATPFENARWTSLRFFVTKHAAPPVGQGMT